MNTKTRQLGKRGRKNQHVRAVDRQRTQRPPKVSKHVIDFVKELIDSVAAINKIPGELIHRIETLEADQGHPLGKLSQ